MKFILGTVLLSTFPSLVLAQGPSGTGHISGGYTRPTWGQYGSTTWGTDSGSVGQNGWNYNSQLHPNEPMGSVLADPNTLNSSFANPSTGAALFQPQDTRLKGRDRP